jgi:hypothetical protein
MVFALNLGGWEAREESLWLGLTHMLLEHNSNPLTPQLNSTAQRCLTRLFTRNFSSWTMHFVNIYMKNQQMQQFFIQFIIIMYGSSYMLRRYIAIFRECF